MFRRLLGFPPNRDDIRAMHQTFMPLSDRMMDCQRLASNWLYDCTQNVRDEYRSDRAIVTKRGDNFDAWLTQGQALNRMLQQMKDDPNLPENYSKYLGQVRVLEGSDDLSWFSAFQPVYPVSDEFSDILIKFSKMEDRMKMCGLNQKCQIDAVNDFVNINRWMTRDLTFREWPYNLDQVRQQFLDKIGGNISKEVKILDSLSKVV